MFNWIKNLFCKPCEQDISFVHIIYELQPEVPDGFKVVPVKRKYKKKKAKVPVVISVEKKKRKYVKSGKYANKNKKRKKGNK